MNRVIFLAVMGAVPLWLAIGLSARDAEKGTAADAARFLKIVEERFAGWDDNGNGVIDSDELNRRIENPAIQDEEAAAIAVLKRTSRIQKVTLPPLSLEGVKRLAEQAPKNDLPNLGAMFAGSLVRIRETKRVLFASELPRLETVRQGRMGNCFCLAPLGALAYHRPEFVAEQMIQKLPDGRYEVKLGNERIRVSPPTDAELALTAGNESDGYWVNVYEKAAAVARNAQREPEKREANPLDLLNRGGSAGTQLAFITGHDMFRFSCKFAKDPKVTKADYDAKLDEIRSALRLAVEEKRLMTCGTLKTKIPGITPNHAYAVLGYDAETDHLQIWNPHGDDRVLSDAPGVKEGYSMKDGVFEMPLLVFVKEFAGLAFEVLPES